MWFMMISSIIVTAITLSHLVDPYTPQAMTRAFQIIGMAALVLGSLGLIGLEKRSTSDQAAAADAHSWGDLFRAILKNRQATVFFWYLIILLAAIMGQDILLEPYAAEAFGLSVRDTTRITSIWGSCVLAAILVAGFMENRLGKRRVAFIGGLGALIGFILIAGSGGLESIQVFYSGVVLLGLGTGLATVSNLSLMLDMTMPGNVGLFIGAWGMANALSRLIGTLLGGVVRDVITQFAQNPISGYVVVFAIEAGMLLLSLWMLQRINVSAFRQQSRLSVVERAAISSEG